MQLNRFVSRVCTATFCAVFKMCHFQFVPFLMNTSGCQNISRFSRILQRPAIAGSNRGEC